MKIKLYIPYVDNNKRLRKNNGIAISVIHYEKALKS